MTSRARGIARATGAAWIARIAIGIPRVAARGGDACQIDTVPLEGDTMGPMTAASRRIHRLSTREFAVAVLAARGHSNHEIARLLHARPQTVKNYLYAVYRTLRVPDRTALTVAMHLAARRLLARERAGRRPA